MKKIINIIFIVLGFHMMSNAQTLDDYYKIAAENNPGLQAKYKNVEAAVQRVSQVSSLSDPILSFSNFISFTGTQGVQRVRFSLTQEFPWFGTLKAQGNAATFTAEAKYQEFLNVRNKLYYQVSVAYYPLYELQSLIAIEKENIRILSSYKSIATINYKNGKGAMVDVLRADILLKESTIGLSILEQNKRPLETLFNTLLNRQDHEPVSIPDSLLPISMLSEYNGDSLLTSNPLLDELELKIDASKATEQVAIKQGFPRLGVGLEYVIMDKSTDMNYSDNGKNELMPMVSISLPIFRKKYKGAQKEAQLMQESYSLQKEEVSNNLTSSFAMTWFEIQKQVELMNLYEVQIQESKQSLNLLFSAYSNSGKDFEEVLRMQQQILNYQNKKVIALTEYYEALAELDYITAKNSTL